MSLTLEDIKELRTGNRNPIRVGELPYDVAMQLGLHNHGVYLSLQSYSHIIATHSDINDFVLLLLPSALKRGLIVREKAKKNILVISYHDAHTGLRFIVALKIAQAQTEVWVSSMYRAKQRQTKSILRRGTVLKNHD